jgi:hypothetical protein
MAGSRWAIDFLDLEADHHEYNSVMLFTNRYSGYVFDIYLRSCTEDSIVDALNYFLSVLSHQFGITPEIVECDGEFTKSNRLHEYFEKRFIRVEPSAPRTQVQNVGAERSGGVIKEKARCIRGEAKLPAFLWVEIYKTAVYLNNRTPK